MTVTILKGDCRDVLRTLPDESVHCVVTSPPYWGLRDYGVAGQIGLEQSPFDYVDEMVAVFRELWRVLRLDGTLWLNLGDSYAGSGRGGNPTEETSGLEGGQASQRASMVRRTRPSDEIGASARDAAVTNVARRALRSGPPSSKSTLRGNGHIGGGPKLQNLPTRFSAACEDGRLHTSYAPAPAGLKQKDLMGMPWRVAFALQADGWWLRQDIIWSKPNPMPESVTDRCTKAHEYLFLLSKSERYYYDADAIKEQAAYSGLANQDDSGFKDPRSFNGKHRNGYRSSGNKSHKAVTEYERSDSEEHRTKAGLLKISDTAYAMRNKRSVWEVSTEPFSEAHFATFPPALIEPCILAGCPKGGTVLDPFGGAGTTGMVADRLGRDAILIELNPEYAAMAERRIRKDAGMFASINQ
jgi:DNA modification methylase